MGAISVFRSRRISSRRSASALILDGLANGTAGNNTITGKLPLTIGPDNLFVHMTGMSDLGWKAVHDNGAQVSIAFPIEMNMRHGTPPIVRDVQSLSTAAEPVRAVAQRRRGVHPDGGLLHPDALRHGNLQRMRS